MIRKFFSPSGFSGDKKPDREGFLRPARGELQASFSYTYGIAATCRSAYYTQDIYSGNRTFSNGSATKSGPTAYGTGTYELRILFIVTDTVNINLSMTCDEYGNII